MSSIKRENSSSTLSNNNIILDIEGTTTSITFVKDVLFPYVREHLEAYVKENYDSEDFQAIVIALRTQANEDKEKKIDGVVEIPEDGEKDLLIKAVIENVLWQMDLDSKAKSLKDLQGLIMEIGYKKGEIKGHVYEDVEPNLKLWSELGKSVYIYSSGSIHAQKLLFGHSEKGDLLPLIKGHFDTTVGKKGDADSYKKIIEQISSSPSETVFFTDVPKEARAAKEAGLLAILLSREGNAPLMDEDKEFQVITSFSEVQFENISKKRKVCTENIEKNCNKSVELCEVSLKPPKEPTISTTTQEHDVDMEVEESSIEKNISNSQKSDIKQINGNVEADSHNQGPTTENSDIEMETSKEVVLENGSEKVLKVVESQKKEDSTDGDAAARGIVSDLKTDNEEKVKPDEPCPLSDKCQEELKPTTNKNKSENTGSETASAINESQKSEENPHLKVVNPDSQKPNGNVISEKSENILKDQPVSDKPQIRQSEDLTNASSGITENKSELDNLVMQNNSGSEMVVEKSSDGLNSKETLSPGINVVDKSQPNSDLSNNLNPHKNENGLSVEATLPEPSQVNINVNGSDSGIVAIVNEKVLPAVIETESLKESSTISESMDSITSVGRKTDLKIQETLHKEVSEVKSADGIQSTENQSAEISSEPKKQTETPISAMEVENIDINLNPCAQGTEEKSSSETVKTLDESSSNQAQSGIKETNCEKNEDKKENGEVDGAEKSVGELCTESEKTSKPNESASELDTVVEAEMKVVSKVSSETQLLSDEIETNHQDSAKKCDGEKAETPEPSQNTEKNSMKEPCLKPNIKETVAANNTNDDELNHLDKVEVSKKTSNGNVDDDAKSKELNEEEVLKTEVSETSVCEVKKCEVPENATVTAVVEA